MSKTNRSAFARVAVAGAVSAALVTVAMPKDARADNNECHDAGQQMQQISTTLYTACQAYNKSAKKSINCDKAAEVAADIQNIVKSLGTVLGIGSKSFKYDNGVSGTIESITKRLWVASSQLTNNNATVAVTHTDGNGKVKVNICAMSYDPNGVPTATLITQQTIEDSKTFSVANVQGQMLSVEIVGKDAARKFGYKLLVKDGK